MNQKTYVLIALTLSLGLNVFFAAALLGRRIGGDETFHDRPLKIAMDHVQSLPEEQRRAAIATLQAAKPELRDAMMEIRKTRKSAFDYIKSPEYNRAEAEKRLAALRDETSALQARAQRLMLDLADQLTPEQRANFMNRK